MKSISIIGLILLALSSLLFYLTTDFSVLKVLTLSHAMGFMAGIGLGLLFGGLVGYVSKGSAVKAEAKRKEFKQLQKEKEELEKQTHV